MFEPKEYTVQIRDFIQALNDEMYPQDMSAVVQVDYQIIDDANPMHPQGLAVASVGIDTPNRQVDPARTKVTITRQANYLVLIRRPTISDEWRKNTGDYLHNMANRIEYENAMRNVHGRPPTQHELLPQFSDTANESIWCSGGMEIGREEVDGALMIEHSLNVIVTYDLVVNLR